MRAADQRALVQAEPAQPAGGAADVARLAAVGAAGQRQLRRAEAGGVRRSRFHQGQRLQRLGGGADEDRAVDVAAAANDFARGGDDGEGAAVGALDSPAPGQLDQDRIGPRVAVGGGGRGHRLGHAQVMLDPWQVPPARL